MPHHHKKKIISVDSYSSESSASSDGTQAPQSPPKNASLVIPQNNYGLFQTVQQQNNTKIDQSKEKTTCCDCLWGWLFKT